MVEFDRQTSHLKSTKIVATTEHGDMEFSYRYSPAILDKAPTIHFDESKHELVDSVDALFDMEMGDINPKVEVGAPAPAFALLDQNGKEHSLESLKGKHVLLDWWGIW